MTLDPCPVPHPTVPNVRDLARERDRWRDLAVRLLWDAARRSTLEAVCVRYGVDPGAVRPEPVRIGVQEAAVAPVVPFPAQPHPHANPTPQEAIL